MTKREKLEKLDELTIDKMLECVKDDKLELLPLFSTVLTYLKANEQVSEKEKQTAGTRHKQMIDEAKKERDNASTK
jgi:hypothetical protein